jgi:hypothetical protein
MVKREERRQERREERIVTEGKERRGKGVRARSIVRGGDCSSLNRRTVTLTVILTMTVTMTVKGFTALQYDLGGRRKGKMEVAMARWMDGCAAALCLFIVTLAVEEENLD